RRGCRAPAPRGCRKRPARPSGGCWWSAPRRRRAAPCPARPRRRAIAAARAAWRPRRRRSRRATRRCGAARPPPCASPRRAARRGASSRRSSWNAFPTLPCPARRMRLMTHPPSEADPDERPQGREERLRPKRAGCGSFGSAPQGLDHEKPLGARHLLHALAGGLERLGVARRDLHQGRAGRLAARDLRAEAAHLGARGEDGVGDLLHVRLEDVPQEEEREGDRRAGAAHGDDAAFGLERVDQRLLPLLGDLQHDAHGDPVAATLAVLVEDADDVASEAAHGGEGLAELAWRVPEFHEDVELHLNVTSLARGPKNATSAKSAKVAMFPVVASFALVALVAFFGPLSITIAPSEEREDRPSSATEGTRSATPRRGPSCRSPSRRAPRSRSGPRRRPPRPCEGPQGAPRWRARRRAPPPARGGAARRRSPRR